MIDNAIFRLLFILENSKHINNQAKKSLVETRLSARLTSEGSVSWFDVS